MLRNLMVALVAVASLSMFLGAAEREEQTMRQSFGVAPGDKLVVDVDSGDIIVRSDSSSRVSITVAKRGATSRLKDFDVTLSQSGDEITVYGRSRRRFLFDPVDARYEVTVPYHFNLLLSTAGGDIQIGNIQGRVVGKTDGGSVDIAHIDGDVDVRTSGAHIRAESICGKGELRTSGASIRVGSVDGPLVAKTSGGPISIGSMRGDLLARTSGHGITVNDAQGAIDASTSGGTVRVRLSRQPKRDSRLSADGGTIVLAVASDIAVDLDARTSGGDVDTEMPVSIFGKASHSEMKGRINGGGPRVELRAAGGDIHVTGM